MKPKDPDPNIPRFNKILRALEASQVDAFLLNSIANVSYAAGFWAPDSYLIASSKGLTLITDFRYTADFRRRAKPPLSIVEYKGSLFKTAASHLKRHSPKRTGFESRHLSFAECEILNKERTKTKLIPLRETLEPVRQIKEVGEIAHIKRALEITKKAYAHIQPMLEPGAREIDIAAELERFIRNNGATASAFDIIVASGPNASYPHAEITERKLKEGEAVIIDMGVVSSSYKCDLTRTFFLGKIKPVVQKAHKAVAEAQKTALDAIRPGKKISSVDRAARQHIAMKGFGKFFGHALGHGVGLEVHEAPSISRKNHNLIQKGMVFTVEPGIYIPGCFGIRIEDMVLVTDKGAEVLTGHGHDLDQPN